MNRLDFFKEQLLFFIGSLFIIIVGLYALLVYKPFVNYRLFFFALIFTLVAFTYFRAKGYYAIGIYPVYLAFGADSVRSPFAREHGAIIFVFEFANVDINQRLANEVEQERW